MPNLEEAIRERAYHLWIADGQPEGHAVVECSAGNPYDVTRRLNRNRSYGAHGFGIGRDHAR